LAGQEDCARAARRFASVTIDQQYNTGEAATKKLFAARAIGVELKLQGESGSKQSGAACGTATSGWWIGHELQSPHWHPLRCSTGLGHHSGTN
jgi:hypothetical protein